ncbi:cobyric acid synthase CobQ [Tepiditoga spiralis]|uniref:Cobyric acid synthase n=1 Tax=Tepiditoga spiralis TaxID=2108365 RepID=A0A7G1G385_9BACT|nr:cobyric acid synthase [Tepiditoga spiralis]BBE30821.1 cobyric acid synthase CobQ [Tepiditoga spiralis]
MGKPIMIVGTSSGAGKSLTVAAICRILTNKGFNVAPFKMQNMSLNSMVSIEGGEMSVAQYVQSIACKKPPSVVYNPILLKPENGKTYIIFKGEFVDKVKPGSYMMDKKMKYFNEGIKDLKKLLSENDYVIIEGAGSPVEINLKPYDITNMAVAKAVNADTIIVTDINRGGSFASIVGTMELLDENEKDLIKGFVFNKFFGSKDLLNDGFDYLEKRYGVKTLGVIPYFKHQIPEEDSMIEWEQKTGDLDIRIVKLPRISNFSDFMPLSWYNGIKYIDSANEVGGDILIIPGSKSTVEDLIWMKENGIYEKILNAHKNKTFIVGICGGFQMFSKKIFDNVESNKTVEGFGFIPYDTHFNEEKRSVNISGNVLFNNKKYEVSGYEIRHGETSIKENEFGTFDGKKSGYLSNKVLGTYLHGIFFNTKFTQEFLNYFRERKGLKHKDFSTISIDNEINNWANFVSKNINLEELL